MLQSIGSGGTDAEAEATGLGGGREVQEGGDTSSSPLPPGLSYLMSESHSGSCHQELCCDSLADSFTTNTLKAPRAGTPGCLELLDAEQPRRKKKTKLSRPFFSQNLSPNPSSPKGCSTAINCPESNKGLRVFFHKETF